MAKKTVKKLKTKVTVKIKGPVHGVKKALVKMAGPIDPYGRHLI